MNADQYAELRSFCAGPKVLSASDLDNPDQGRTLLYGYTGDSDTFHVYLKGKLIHVTIYKNHYGRSPDDVRFTASHECLDLNDIPGGHIYPAACDAQFCRLAINNGHGFSFAGFEAREDKPFHGKLIEDLPAVG